MPRMKSPDTTTPAERKAGQARMLQLLLGVTNLATDAALAERLGFPPPVLSKIRNGIRPVGDTFFLRAHEKLDVPVAEMRRAIAGTQQ